VRRKLPRKPVPPPEKEQEQTTSGVTANGGGHAVSVHKTSTPASPQAVLMPAMATATVTTEGYATAISPIITSTNASHWNTHTPAAETWVRHMFHPTTDDRPTRRTVSPCSYDEPASSRSLPFKLDMWDAFSPHQSTSQRELPPQQQEPWRPSSLQAAASHSHYHPQYPIPPVSRPETHPPAHQRSSSLPAQLQYPPQQGQALDPLPNRYQPQAPPAHGPGVHRDGHYAAMHLQSQHAPSYSQATGPPPPPSPPPPMRYSTAGVSYPQPQLQGASNTSNRDDSWVDRRIPYDPSTRRGAEGFGYSIGPISGFDTLPTHTREPPSSIPSLGYLTLDDLTAPRRHIASHIESVRNDLDWLRDDTSSRRVANIPPPPQGPPRSSTFAPNGEPAQLYRYF
jgi:hypothetical protein